MSMLRLQILAFSCTPPWRILDVYLPVTGKWTSESGFNFFDQPLCIYYI